MFAKAFDYQDEPSVAKQGVMTMRYNYGLSTVPNRPIVKPFDHASRIRNV